MKKGFPKAIVIVLLIMAALLVGVGTMSAMSASPVKLPSAAQPNKNYKITMKITGQKAGLIGDKIAVVAVSHSIVSPRDIQSGLPTGQRMHKPFVITKEVDKISPALYNTLCTNENLTEVVLTFTSGNPKDSYTIKLTNANIASIDLRQAVNGNGFTYEEIAFTYQKITWTYGNGATSEDDWEAPVS